MCDASRQVRRPLLLRIPSARTLAEGRVCCGRAVAAGFDGVEASAAALSLMQPGAGVFFPRAAAETDASRGGGPVIAARCATTDAHEARDLVAELIESTAALGGRRLNLEIAGLSLESEHGFSTHQQAINFAHGLLRDVRFACEAARRFAATHLCRP